MDIVVNGTHYSSWEEVPPELRATVGRALPDADGDGVPDLLQGHLPTGLPGGRVVTTSTVITVGDQTYHSLDEVPDEVRSALAAAGLAPPPGSAPAPLSAGDHEMARPPAPAGPPPAGSVPPGQVLPDGVPLDASQGAPGTVRKKHWWQRG